jgi:hypothetical protein
MSAVVKVAGKMPADDDMNGLDATLPKLLREPEKLQAAVVFYNVAKITTTPETGTEIPTVVLRRFEPIGEAGKLGEAVTEVMMQAAAKRTGKEPLPVDTVEVVEQGALTDAEHAAGQG